MTLRPVEYRSFDGGAAIIARHVAAMGAQATLVTALPRHEGGRAMQQRLNVEGVHVVPLEVDADIIEKQRFLVGTSKVMKLDLGDPLSLDVAHRRRLRGLASEAAARCDAVILADFGQGLLTATSLVELCESLRPLARILGGDVSGRRSSLLSLRGMDVLCPSESEARDALHDYDQGLSAIAWNLLHRTNSRAAVITQGHDGLTAFERNADAEVRLEDWRTRLSAEHVPSFVRYPVDQLGCGDALLAALTLMLASGEPLARAAIVGSLAAAAQASQLGNSAIGTADLRRGLRRLDEAQLTVDARPNISFTRTNHDQLRPAHARSA
jgi:bifunctional ADP-heptose synthase (sugar kinase/adenylyltransferase)